VQYTIFAKKVKQDFPRLGVITGAFAAFLPKRALPQFFRDVSTMLNMIGKFFELRMRVSRRITTAKECR